MATLMTGVAGIPGSETGPALAREEEVFFLVRGGKSHRKIPDGIDPQKIIPGDIVKPLCGLKDEDIEAFEGLIDRIVHLAANVSFEIYDKNGMIRKTNYDGTRNMVDLACKLKVKEFHHCSTVYLAGRNPYEQSKAEAESLIQDNGFDWDIYRPSAIVGDSKTGHTSGFNGFYGVFAVFHALAEKARSKKMSLFGEVSLPVYVLSSPVFTINLIQSDWVRDTMLKLLKKGAKNKIYNIAHPYPPQSRWVWETGFNVLGIRDIKFLDELTDNIHKDRKLRIIQKGIDDILIRYQPYVLHEDRFSLDTVRQALGTEYSDPPEITSQFIYKLLKYAVEKNFGRGNSGNGFLH